MVHIDVRLVSVRVHDSLCFRFSLLPGFGEVDEVLANYLPPPVRYDKALLPIRVPAAPTSSATAAP